MSNTPIPDRLAPLPPRVQTRSGMILVIVVWFSVFLMLAVSVLLGRPPMLRQWLLNDVPKWIESHGIGRRIGSVAVWTAIVSLVMVTVHEGGHALCGMAVGFRFKSIRLGPLHLTVCPGFRSFEDLSTHSRALPPWFLPRQGRSRDP